jgi:hypothetical protein
MNLYKRDYSILTADEKSEWQFLKEKEVIEGSGKLKIIRSLFRQYPKAARHFESYFPNHYLDPVELSERERLTAQLNEFSEFLNSDNVSERKILNFINHDHRYFLIASILNYYHFGHHDAYLFPEFQIGNTYKADYLIVGLGSGGWEFIFIELEAPKGNITKQDGDTGDAFRKGLTQIENWDTWLDSNYLSLNETFTKYKKNGKTLPEDFTKMDKSRFHFVIIAGRRDDFNEKTYRIQRKKLKEGSIRLLHYDNIIDCAQKIIGAVTY